MLLLRFATYQQPLQYLLFLLYKLNQIQDKLVPPHLYELIYNLQHLPP